MKREVILLIIFTCITYSISAQSNESKGIYNYFGQDTLLKSDYNPYLKKNRVVINLKDCLVKISKNGFITKVSSNEEKLALATDIYIPDFLDSIKVTGLLEMGITNLSRVKSIRLPKELIVLNEPSFRNQLIDSIVLPKTLRYIDSKSLMGNHAFKNLRLHKPSNIECHDFLFWRSGASSGLKDTVEIGQPFQEYQSYIAQYNYKKSGYYQLLKNDIIINNNGKVGRCFYLGSDSIQLLSRMAGVEILEIDKEAFAFKNIKSFLIPNGVRIIGENAFYNNRLSDINIPESVIKIGRGAFKKNCISKINYPKNVNCIEEQLFAYNNFVKLEIPKHIKKIKKGAFRGNKIKTLKLNNQLIFIGRLAFANNILTDIYLPSPVIKGKTFLHWQSFKKGKYNSKTKSFEETPVAKCQAGEKMDLKLGYKAVFKEDL